MTIFLNDDKIIVIVSFRQKMLLTKTPFLALPPKLHNFPYSRCTAALLLLMPSYNFMTVGMLFKTGPKCSEAAGSNPVPFVCKSHNLIVKFSVIFNFTFLMQNAVSATSKTLNSYAFPSYFNLFCTLDKF